MSILVSFRAILPTHCARLEHVRVYGLSAALLNQYRQKDRTQPVTLFVLQRTYYKHSEGSALRVRARTRLFTATPES